MAVKIQGVAPGSAASKAGLAPGMSLVMIDGHEINDGLDYEFYSTGKKLRVLAQAPGKEPQEILVVKPEYQPLGCEFDSYLIDKQHSCKNKCVFCFVDQLPQGMRKPLYFKDDDERLSFLFGNYVTLTNLSDREVNRIIEMRISPVNISVHTTNPELRVKMMNNKHAGEVLRYIPLLAENGIQMNTQLVLCPGLNDGEELRRSIEELAGFYPQLQSIAAVPVGLTKFREGLYPLKPYDRQGAAEQLAIMLEYGERFKQRHGVRLVYPSDEWFLLAGMPIPEEDFYDGYLQLENGVGMWRLTQDEFMQALEDTPQAVDKAEADMIVGELAAPLLQQLSRELEDKFPEVKLHVHVVRNDFFGHGITVTGLLTGQDIIAQLKGKMHSSTLLLPSNVLRAERDLLLDGATPEEIARELGVEICIVENGGDNLLQAVLEAKI